MRPRKSLAAGAKPAAVRAWLEAVLASGAKPWRYFLVSRWICVSNAPDIELKKLLYIYICAPTHIYYTHISECMVKGAVDSLVKDSFS